MYLVYNLLYYCFLIKFKLNSNWFMFLYDEYFIVFFIVNRLLYIFFSIWVIVLIKNDLNI